MSIHAHETFQDRTLLPRGLIKRRGVASYHFAVGQTVSFGDETWTVINRDATAMGRRHYEIFRAGDERPTRIVQEGYLAPAVVDL